MSSANFEASRSKSAIVSSQYRRASVRLTETRVIESAVGKWIFRPSREKSFPAFRDRTATQAAAVEQRRGAEIWPDHPGLANPCPKRRESHAAKAARRRRAVSGLPN